MKKARIVVQRVDGSDGIAACRVKNDDVLECPNPAKEFQDFLPFDKEISFGPGVCDTLFEVDLEGEDVLKRITEDQDPTESSRLPPAVTFYVRLFDPTPAGVRISKKNTCVVEIIPEE